MELVLAIVGDRRYVDYAHFSRLVAEELERFPATAIVTGDATGVDTMAKDYAEEHNLPYTVYCASSITYKRLKSEGVNVVAASDWAEQSKAAGHIRNTAVLKACNRVLLFHGGGPGSENIKRQASKMRIEVEEYRIEWSTPRVEGAINVALG